mmetsp:Transcript_13213/g.22413  ORF Transcript_13213/g.22413 Transcript_13213/m.22413 type:complete len:118 (-) Transcript_13213:7-360(-)
MQQFMMESRCLHRVVLLVDSTTGLLDSDKLLIDMMQDLDKVYFVVLTKADKLKGGEQIEERVKEVQKYVIGTGTKGVPIIHAVSAMGVQSGRKAGETRVERYGVAELLSNLAFHLKY